VRKEGQHNFYGTPHQTLFKSIRNRGAEHVAPMGALTNAYR
jgi:hypothetical protein